MAIIQSLIHSHTKIFWACIKFCADVVILCLPSKKLRRLTEELARLSQRPSPTHVEALMKRMNEAKSLAEYENCTIDLDNLQGHETWKREKESIEPGYNPNVIETQVKLLQKAVIFGDLSSMQYLLRTGLSRDLDGYINTVLETIETFSNIICRQRACTADLRSYQRSLEDTLIDFGRSALTLSGGASLCMKHIGVVKTLWEAALLPRIISGTSLGSFVAGIVGSTTEEQMDEVLDRLPFSDLAIFDPPGTGKLGWVIQRVRTLLSSGVFFETKNLKKVARSWLGDITFREAHNKTGYILNICISSTDSAEPQLLNFITAPDVYIWSAICASCAVPGIFSPVNIYEKDPITKEEKLWIQNIQKTFVGSTDHDIPMRKLSEMFNAKLFIISQVNPYIRAFLEPEEQFRGRQPKTLITPQNYLQATKAFLQREIVHRAQQAVKIGFPQKWFWWAPIFSQRYTDGINIWPEIKSSEYLHMMMNPSPEFILDAMIAGERAIWPRMCRIKNCVAIELSLVQAIDILKDRVNFGPEARAARMV
ncbi:hypothetical protein CLAIMM_08562 [Cladophialophora immunda]|nr:hypothetical protein CLAIMM_08562 [Cladophialophora immunda]